jgi:sortase A
MKKSKAASGKLLRWLERCLLLAAMLGLGAWIGSNTVAAVWQNWENWVFDRDIRGEGANLADYLADYLTNAETSLIREVRNWMRLGDIPKTSESFPSTVSPERRKQLGPDGLIGRLTIPRLHLRAMVQEGVGKDILGIALGHIPGTALPWQNGNVGVAGHRDTLFRGLSGIRQHDLIQLETLDKHYAYEVVSTEIVKPSDVEVLRADSYPEITLVTCYPFNYIGPAPDRFIVKARLVTKELPEPKETAEATAATTTATTTTTEPSDEIAIDTTRSKPAAARKVYFAVSKDHSRQLAPGISLGITATDADSQQVNGWMWVMPDRRTLWLRTQGTREPLVFYGHQDGKKRELVITSVTPSSATGYLLLPAI